MNSAHESAVDLYEHPSPCIPTGENAITIEDDGSVSVERKAPDERTQTRKDAKAIRELPDELIERVKETDLACYYRIAVTPAVTVTDRVSGTWLCHTCQTQDRWSDDDRKGCVHIQRVKRWAADHPQQEAAA